MAKISKIYQNQLENLGLSKNETLVYLALLELGLSSTGPITKQTSLHSQLVYQALDKLVERNLASFITKRNRKYFQASDPGGLLENVHKMEDLAKNLVPDLRTLQKKDKNPLQVKIMYGHEGFVSNLQDVVGLAASHDKIMRIIGGASGRDFYEAVGDWYENYVNLLARKKVAKWQISPEGTSVEFKEKFAKEDNTILKIMPSSFASPTQTRITPELITVEIYDVEIVVIQIWNKAIAQSYLNNFDFLWKQGKRYLPKK